MSSLQFLPLLSLHSPHISSLSRNFDELNALLAQLGFDFSIIGISESRLLMHNASVFNFSIEGYSVEHTPTESAAGGALLYMTRSSRNVLLILWVNLSLFLSKFRFLIDAILLLGVFINIPKCRLTPSIRTFYLLFCKPLTLSLIHI